MLKLIITSNPVVAKRRYVLRFLFPLSLLSLNFLVMGLAKKRLSQASTNVGSSRDNVFSISDAMVMKYIILRFFSVQGRSLISSMHPRQVK